MRASGVKWDIRKAMPYAAYDLYKFEIPTGKNGDTLTGTSCAWKKCGSRA
jgi:NADH:ubiquinone oxidoreductase subunit D